MKLIRVYARSVVPAALVVWLLLSLVRAQVSVSGTLSAQITTVKSRNNVLFADQFLGTDACAKINAAEAALSSGGGVVEARGLFGTQNCSTALTIGSSTQTVQLLLGNVLLQVPSLVTVHAGSEIRGLGPAGAPSGSNAATTIQAEGGFPANSSVLKFQTSASTGSHIRDLVVDCATQPGCTGIDSQNVEDFTEIKDVSIRNYESKCIDFTGATSQAVSVQNVTCSAASNAGGTTAVAMNSTGDQWYLINFSVTAALLTQQSVGILCSGCQFYLFGYHAQAVNGAIQLTGTSNGSPVISGVNSCCGVVNTLHITSTWNGSVAASALKFFPGGTTTIKNDIAAFNNSCTNAALSAFSLSSTASSPQQLFSTCSSFVSILKGVPQLVASSTSTLGTGAIAATNCATAVTTNAVGAVTTDTISWSLTLRQRGIHRRPVQV
jgi:hypothetical protein